MSETAMTSEDLESAKAAIALYLFSLTFDYGVTALHELPDEEVVLQSQAGGMTAQVRIKDLRRILAGYVAEPKES